MSELALSMRMNSKDYEYNALVRLDTLWNIDKHRRIPVVGFKPGVLGWGSDGEHKRGIYARKPTTLTRSSAFAYTTTRRLATSLPESTTTYNCKLPTTLPTLDAVTSLKRLPRSRQGTGSSKYPENDRDC